MNEIDSRTAARSHPVAVLIYRALQGTGGLAGMIVLYFFLVGLADGSISLSNILAWLLVWSVLLGMLGGAFVLRRRGRIGWAIALLSGFAVPFGVVLFFAISFFSAPHWN